MPPQSPHGPHGPSAVIRICPNAYIKQYFNGIVYREDLPNGAYTEITQTSLSSRVPGTESQPRHPLHFLHSNESSTKTVGVPRQSFIPTPAWADAIDDFPRDEDAPPLVNPAAPPAARPAAAAPAAPEAPAAIPLAGADAALPPAPAAAPGSSANAPIFVIDNSPDRRVNNRNHTRNFWHQTGTVMFSAGSVQWILPGSATDPAAIRTVHRPMQRQVAQSGADISRQQEEPRALRPIIDRNRFYWSRAPDHDTSTPAAAKRKYGEGSNATAGPSSAASASVAKKKRTGA